MATEKQSVEEMQKIIFETLYLRGLKRLLSRRKNPDGLVYQSTLDRVKEKEKELKNRK